MRVKALNIVSLYIATKSKTNALKLLVIFVLIT